MDVHLRLGGASPVQSPKPERVRVGYLALLSLACHPSTGGRVIGQLVPGFPIAQASRDCAPWDGAPGSVLLAIVCGEGDLGGDVSEDETMRGMFVVAALIAPGVTQAQTQAAWPLPTVELPGPLARVLRDYEAAWKAGDGVRLAEVFTPDGFILPNGQLPKRGTPAIQTSHQRPGGELQLVAFGYTTSDTVGYIVGGYRYPTTVGPGGKFVLALRRDRQGAWRIAADIENGSERR